MGTFLRRAKSVKVVNKPVICIKMTQVLERPLLYKKMNKHTIMKNILGMLLFSATCSNAQTMMVRISEIEILPEYLTEYNAILKEEAAASVEKEKGVVAIFSDEFQATANPDQDRRDLRG
jgi:hypothetical protein